jgi:hypothetical protein
MKDHAALHSTAQTVACGVVSSLLPVTLHFLMQHQSSISSLIIPHHPPLSSLVIPHHPASSLQSSSACSSSSSSLSFFWHHSLLSFSFVCSHSCTGIMLEDHASQQLTQLLEV